MVKFNIEEESLLITKGRVMMMKLQPFWQEKIAIVKKNYAIIKPFRDYFWLDYRELMKGPSIEYI